MGLAALSLITASAGLHALWNFLAKRAGDEVSFMFLLMATSPLLWLGPMIWMLLHGYHFGPWYVWVISGLFQALYCFLMGRGYECGDLSQVYPLARGLAPGLIAIVAWPLMGERLSPMGMVGIAAVIGGVLLLHTDDCRGLVNGDSLRALWRPGSRMGLLAAVCIAGYHITDKYGALEATTPLAYLCAMHVFLIVFLGLITLTARTRGQIAAEWRRNWKIVLVGTACCFIAYLMIVTAMTMAEVAYVAALRNVSILIGVVLGLTALREKGMAWRLGGALLLLGGLVIVALGG